MKLTKNSKNYILLFIITFLVTFFYYSPFLMSSLRGFKPALRFTGDLQLAGYPAFIQTGKYFSDWVFSGIDFFTANGSSSLFLRPNFSSYYLPQFLLQNIFHITNNGLAAKMFMVQMWVNGFIAMLFTTLWLKQITRINIYHSLLGGALFFSIVSYSYQQTSFMNVACTFPVLCYCLSISLTRKTNLYEKILLSIPLIMSLTAGYLPLGAMGIVVAVISSLIVCKYIYGEGQNYKDFAIVLGFGFLVSVGYLLAVVRAVHIGLSLASMSNMPLTESIFFSDLSLSFTDVMRIFLAAVRPGIGEGPHFLLGMPFLILLYVCYYHLFSNSTTVWKKNTFIICIIVFLLSILVSMGNASGFADMFFYSVPSFGGMHVYARYMLTSVFFIVFAITLGLSDLYVSDKPLNLRIPSIGIVFVLIIMLLFPHILTENKISLPILSAEILISILVLFALHLRRNNISALILVPLLLFSQGSFMYMQANWISLSNPGNASKDIVNSNSRMANLISYFYANTDKLLVKYIDLTPEIEKHGGVPHNFPWFIRYQPSDTRRISSYMGYDQGPSQQREYAQKFSYFSQYDKDYLIESGADYVLYDRKTQDKEANWLKTVIDSRVPEYDIGNGFFAAKISKSIMHTTESKFDNGVFNVLSNDINFNVESFKTNWSTKTQLNFNTSQKGTLYLELFPHKYLNFYINGVRVKPIYSKSGLAYFTFSPGQNKFVMSYANTPFFFFLYTYFFYLMVITCILIRYAWAVIRGNSFRTKSSTHSN